MSKLDEEIADLKRLYPNATYIGVADGARENWSYLKQHTSGQILDFYHASEYLAGAAEALFPTSKAKRHQWLEDRLHSQGKIMKHPEISGPKVYKLKHV